MHTILTFLNSLHLIFIGGIHDGLQAGSENSSPAFIVFVLRRTVGDRELL